MHGISLCALVLAPVLAIGCSSSDDSESDAGGGAVAPATSDMAGASGGTTGGDLDAEPSCDGITGTYSAQRRRDPDRPGSCAETEINPNFPIRVSLSADGASYRIEAGYSRVGEDPTFSTCSAVNVVGCRVFATCHDGTDQVEFTVTGSQVSGAIDRTDSANQNCTINFTFTGART